MPPARPGCPAQRQTCGHAGASRRDQWREQFHTDFKPDLERNRSPAGNWCSGSVSTTAPPTRSHGRARSLPGQRSYSEVAKTPQCRSCGNLESEAALWGRFVCQRQAKSARYGRAALGAAASGWRVLSAARCAKRECRRTGTRSSSSLATPVDQAASCWCTVARRRSMRPSRPIHRRTRTWLRCNAAVNRP